MSWTHELVNGRSGDAGLLSVDSQSGESILCDAGTLSNLSERQLMRVGALCFTHHHMDHSQGFQRWLRVRVRHEDRSWLTVVGPSGTLDAVLGHLSSYAWNLLEDDWFSFEIYEYDGLLSRRSFVRFSGGAYVDFQEEDVPLPKGLSCLVLEHDIDVLGYLWKKEPFFRFDRSSSLSPGPWVQELKDKVAKGLWEDAIETPQGSLKVQDLRDQCLEQVEPSFAYLTDFGFTAENLARLKSLPHGVDEVFCEASFPAHERQRALRLRHLTSYQSALIARLLGASHYFPFHVSPAFDVDETYAEALRLFEETKKSSSELSNLIETELCLVDR